MRVQERQLLLLCCHRWCLCVACAPVTAIIGNCGRPLGLLAAWS